MVFRSYGQYYDIIYADKDYEKECDFLEKIFRKYSKSKPNTILDAGSGTGSHAIPMARRGYKVTGIDASEMMVNIAKEKTRKSGINIDFYAMDLRELWLNKKFDACICMFAVIDYLTENQDIQKALLNIRKHLKTGSLFVFDFWYGPAVLTILPSKEMKMIEKNEIRVIRFAEPRLDTLHHLCKVSYYLIATKANLIIEEVREKHVVRFFFPEEIKHFVEENGFKLLKLSQFLRLEAEPNEETWDAVAVCEAV